MRKNKIGKYFKYAIGEIVLVMIGILLALQVNNWNQDRMNRKKSLSYMKSLVEDLESDINQYNINITSYRTDIDNNKRLFINNEYKTLEVDSILKLVNLFYMPNRTTRQTYDKIKNAGLVDFLGSEVINKEINEYYNVKLNYYDTLLEWDKEYSLKYYNYWFYNDNFEASSTRDYGTNALPFMASNEKRKSDLISLIESTKGRNYLRGAIVRHEHTTKRVTELKIFAEYLVELINKELNH